MSMHTDGSSSLLAPNRPVRSQGTDGMKTQSWMENFVERLFLAAYMGGSPGGEGEARTRGHASTILSVMGW